VARPWDRKIRVHQTARLQGGQRLRVGGRSGFPYCDANIGGTSTYVQVLLLFSFADVAYALAVELQEDRRARHAQIALARLQPLRPKDSHVLLRLHQIQVQVAVVPNFSSRHEDALLLNRFVA